MMQSPRPSWTTFFWRTSSGGFKSKNSIFTTMVTVSTPTAVLLPNAPSKPTTSTSRWLSAAGGSSMAAAHSGAQSSLSRGRDPPRKSPFTSNSSQTRKRYSPREPASKRPPLRPLGAKGHMKVTINPSQELFVIEHTGGCSCLGFNNCFDDAAQMAGLLGTTKPDPKQKGTL